MAEVLSLSGVILSEIVRARAKIRARIERVEDGNLGDYKSVGAGIFELKLPICCL